LKNEELTLNILRTLPKVNSQKTLAEILSFSIGKTNYVLKALIDKGFIKAENFFHKNNKNQYRYLLTEEGLKEKVKLTKKFIARKKAEYEELQRELEKMKKEKNV